MGTSYRGVLRVRAFRCLFIAKAQSDFGDYLARVALMYLVFQNGHSAMLAAAAYAVTYFPWLFGPVLGVVADRCRRRTVMIVCDLARALLYALLALPGLPVGALIGIAFAAGIFSVPFASARAALVPEILEGEAYVVASGLSASAAQVAQLAGFAVGGAVVFAIRPGGALLLDAATFLVSAVLVRHGVDRESGRPGTASARGAASAVRSGLLHVFGRRELLAPLLLIWTASLFTYAFEAQTAALSTSLGGGPALGGLLLAAAPAGLAVGSVIVTRRTPAALRPRLVAPLAIAASAIQMLLWLRPAPGLIIVLLTCVGAASAYSTVLNATFVQAVDPEFRGRAMGVAVAGINLGQGLGAVGLGAAVRELGAADAIGWVGLCGTAATFAVLPLWRRVLTHTRSSAARPRVAR